MKDRIKELDKADMWSAIKGCPQQINHILDTYADWVPGQAVELPQQVLFLGMGGSAIGGDIVRIWVERFAAVPMMVIRNYDVPHWTGPGTLVLASSYSGDTEETLAATGQAAERGGRVVAIASGGQLARLAHNAGWDFVQIPAGLQPRAAIGYSLAAVVRVLVAFQVLGASVLDELAAAAELMRAEGECWSDPEQPENKPLGVARLIGNRLPVIYGAAGTTEGLAIRLRSQLAENSKLFASHHVLPEQNHNEIVGLTDRIRDHGDTFVIWLTDKDDHPRVQLRQDLSRRLMGTKEQPQASQPMEWILAGRGESLIQRNLSLLHQIDWLSYWVALLRGYDPSVIEVLTELKNEMKGSRT
ncbi:MAG: bifunctional phosphoglucose/phosphomannose isomerase [Candidatus Neomarinimicrobiota bacterium]